MIFYLYFLRILSAQTVKMRTILITVDTPETDRIHVKTRSDFIKYLRNKVIHEFIIFGYKYKKIPIDNIQISFPYLKNILNNLIDAKFHYLPQNNLYLLKNKLKKKIENKFFSQKIKQCWDIKHKNIFLKHLIFYLHKYTLSLDEDTRNVHGIEDFFHFIFQNLHQYISPYKTLNDPYQYLDTENGKVRKKEIKDKIKICFYDIENVRFTNQFIINTITEDISKMKKDDLLIICINLNPILYLLNRVSLYMSRMTSYDRRLVINIFHSCSIGFFVNFMKKSINEIIMLCNSFLYTVKIKLIKESTNSYDYFLEYFSKKFQLNENEKEEMKKIMDKYIVKLQNYEYKIYIDIKKI